MQKINSAHSVLNFIGGTASMVAGFDSHFWADSQMAKKARTRGRTGGGTYGKSLQAHFDQARRARSTAKAKSLI